MAIGCYEASGSAAGCGVSASEGCKSRALVRQRVAAPAVEPSGLRGN